MISLEAYKKFILKINNLNTADNLDVSTGEFVLLFNEQQNKWFRNKFKGRSAIYSIDDVQQLIEADMSLVSSATTSTRFQEYKMPSNYLDYISSYALAKKDTCIDRTIYTYQVKLDNINTHLKDINNWPSFEYQEAPITLSSDNIQFYTTDFIITSTYLTYYRYPINIDIAGYTRLDGTTSTNIDPELYDQAVDEIIDWCRVEFQRISENTEGFQLSENSINKNN